MKNLFYAALLATAAYSMNAGAQNLSIENPKAVKILSNEKEKRIDILIGGQPFTSYIWPDNIKKPVLYPVLTAAGNPVTRGWPLQPRPGERVDHPHHIGVWFNFGDVNGYDFWNNSDQAARDHKGPFGTIRHKKVNKIVSGKDKGELDVTMEWFPGEKKAVLRENTKFIFSGNDSIRIIDRITTLTALDEKVDFKDNKEGLIALRVARELEHPSNKPEKFTDAQGNVTNVPVLNNEGVTGHYISSEGREGDSVWGTRAKWVILNGNIKGEPVAVMILDHPQNPGYPAYWHARGYGLFGANSLGQNAMSGGKETLNFSLDAGKSVTFKYRILVSSAKQLSAEDASSLFKKFTGN
ncbi:DUF6807 domain-containing protein [Pararcticibacter amylolyticus]|uniref:Methane oxygenase PmoA n=1 Tax=Pararcticibacter amylolyticus TaxID=2173175 RepID=A0A2U2PDY2_9SPHI|nr:PmoA family protein [Pararcticibacter amylolyticus]PWG79596.1 hypothetical protein DDR33_16140 [Pararcticibacter amylolyticus]